MFAPLTFPEYAFSAVTAELLINLCHFNIFYVSLCYGYLIFLRLYGIIFIVINAAPTERKGKPLCLTEEK